MVCRPFIYAWKNIFEFLVALCYALLFWGSIMIVKADCWDLNVSDIEV